MHMPCFPVRGILLYKQSSGQCVRWVRISQTENHAYIEKVGSTVNTSLKRLGMTLTWLPIKYVVFKKDEVTFLNHQSETFHPCKEQLDFFLKLR